MRSGLWMFLCLLSTSLLCAQVASFETCPPGPLLTCGEPWTSGGGTVTIVPNGPIAGPTSGFPTAGNQWAIVNAGSTGNLSSPANGPAPYPLAGQTGSISMPVTIPASPTGAVVIAFDYTYVTPECASDPQYNDFMTVDLVDPGSLTSVLNLLYIDTFSPNLSAPAVSPNEAGIVVGGFCNPPGTLEVGVPGTPKRVSVMVPPIHYGQTLNLEFHVGNGFDTAFSSYAYIDNVSVSFSQAPPEYQVNQLDAHLDIDGAGGTPDRPIDVLRWSQESSNINFQSLQTGQPWDLGITLVPGLPASMGGLSTPGGQIISLDLAHPSTFFLNGLSFAVPFSNVTLPVAPPAPFDIYAQMVVFSPSHPEGLALSSLIGLHVRDAEGAELTGTVPDLAGIGGHSIQVLSAPTPNGLNAPEWSTGPVGSTTFGDVTLIYTSGGVTTTLTQAVELDNLGLTITVGGQVVTNLGHIFPGLGGLVGVSATVVIRFDGSVAVRIQGMVLVAVGPTYITDKIPPRIVAHLTDGAPGAPNLTQAQSNAAITAIGLAAVLANKVGGPTDAYDCHGWTFANGNHWIDDCEVGKILADNGYVVRMAPNIMVGTLVVYRNPARITATNPTGITHSGVVTIVMGGAATQVESKWGRLGRYKHGPMQVPASYGTPTYYNSPRVGHKLKSVP